MVSTKCKRNEMMNKVKWLLVGAGDIATRRAGPALVEVKNSELIAICDLNQERAAKLAGQLKVKAVYTDYAKALAESGADAVYLATPQSTHIEMSCSVENLLIHVIPSVSEESFSDLSV